MFSVRLLSVEAWAPPASQGSSSTVSVFWSTGNASFGSQREVSDSSNSVSQPAHIVAGPPAQSAAAFWQEPNAYNANALFELDCPSGTIVDVVLKLVAADGTTAFEQSVSTAVANKVYYMALDAVANNHLKPVSLTTTT